MSYKGNRYIFLVLLIVSVTFVLWGCNSDTFVYPPEITLEDNEMFLFNPADNRLGIYNLKEKTWSEIDTGYAFFQGFDFGNEYPYFILGAPNLCEFYAGMIKNEKLTFNYELSDLTKAMTPLATNGEEFYYLIESFDEKDQTRRVITISDSGKEKLLVSLDSMGVMGGVVAGNYLYFTCPREDSGDYYNVYKINLRGDTQKQEPILVRDDCKSYRLYQYNGKVLYLDTEKQVLCNDELEVELECDSVLCFVDDEKDFVALQTINENNNLVLIFIDVFTNEILGKYENAINYKRDGSVITIYGDGFTEILNLGEEK